MTYYDCILLDLIDIATIIRWSYYRGGLITAVVFVKRYLLIMKFWLISVFQFPFSVSAVSNCHYILVIMYTSQKPLLALKSAWFFFYLRNTFYFVLIQNGLAYSANSWPNTLTIDIKQKFINWAIRGRLNNHCNNKDLLGMKRRRTEPYFLLTSGIKSQSAIFNYTAPTWAVYGCTRHWMANQPAFERSR